jgi:peptidoglycan/LPS O-acetylase OafA/YrhL
MSLVHEPDATQVRQFRPEIQGLRAVAAVSVACYHVWFERASGAVDIFFVVSGFLIIGSLARRAAATGRVDLGAFWTRIARRIVPAAYVVLLAVALGTVLVISKVYWQDTFDDIIAAALYRANWAFAANAVDYNAHGEFQSPVLHYWALSIQGQFYLAAPILVLVVVAFADRVRVARTTVLAVTLVAVLVASFAYAQVAVRADQSVAYFSAPARAWEFCLGGLLALALPRLSLAPMVRRLAGAIGILAILLTGPLIDVAGTFPGTLALFPTLGACLVIVSGDTVHRGRVVTALGAKPMMRLGDLSYGLFLWHWPIYILTLQYLNIGSASATLGTSILLISLGLSWVTLRYVERPLTERRAVRSRLLSRPELAGMIAIPFALFSVAATIGGTGAQVPISDLQLGDEPRPTAEHVVPDLATAARDRPAYYRDERCHSRSSRREEGGPEAVTCTYGIDGGSPRVAVVGGSHSAQWQPALEVIANTHGWQLDTYTRVNCRFAEGVKGECAEWNDNVLEALLDDPPDFIVTTATSARDQKDHVPKGFLPRWLTLLDAGIDVVGIRDNPEFPFNPIECVERSGSMSPDCSVSVDDVLNETNPAAELDLPRGVHLVDMTRHICATDQCWSVHGEVLIYRDTHHLSATFSQAIAAALDREIQSQAPLLDAY